MHSPATSHAGERTHELRFRSLFNEGRGYAFPCDRHGTVDIDELSERGRRNYLFARAVIGSEFFLPVVIPVAAADELRH